MKLRLLSQTPDAKTKKSLKKDYTTFILYLDPRMKNICQWATKGCKAGCLFTAGHGAMNYVMEARRRKTQWFINDPEGFKRQLQDELRQIRAWSTRTKKKYCIRLNGTSDLDFRDIIRTNYETLFYDYTKSVSKYTTIQNDPSITNYHLTFSRSETNENDCKVILQSGGNVAVVFEKDLPETFLGYKVINGDDTDLRFLDPKNVVVGLKAKGKARKDDYGFTVKKELPMVSA